VSFLVGADYMSRYVIALPTKAATARIAWLFMVDHVAAHFGWPDRIFSDNGTHFTGEEFTGRLAQFKVKHVFAPTRAPWVVGLAERFVKMILNIMRAESAGDIRVIRHWDEYVGQAMQAINTRSIAAHGYSPAEVFLGFQPRCFGDRHVDNDILAEAIQGQQEMGRADLAIAADVHDEEICSRRESVCSRQQARHEESLQLDNRRTFKMNDLVLLRRTDLDGIHGRKLEPRWHGPFLIARILNNHRSVILNDLSSGLRLGKFHIDHVKRFVPRSSDVLGEAQRLSD
jgi:transposase InsO family protein